MHLYWLIGCVQDSLKDEHYGISMPSVKMRKIVQVMAYWQRNDGDSYCDHYNHHDQHSDKKQPHHLRDRLNQNILNHYFSRHRLMTSTASWNPKQRRLCCTPPPLADPYHVQNFYLRWACPDWETLLRCITHSKSGKLTELKDVNNSGRSSYRCVGPWRSSHSTACCHHCGDQCSKNGWS